jgi:shikimate 5-dehydrogenase
MASYDETSKAPVQGANFLLPHADGWTARNILGTAVTHALMTALHVEGDSALKGRTVMLTGAGPLTRMVAGPLRAHGAGLIWANKNKNTALTMSQTFGGRQLLWDAIYSTHHDVLIIGRDGVGLPEDVLADDDAMPLHPGYLKETMTIIDLTSGVRPSKFLREARSRGAKIITKAHLLLEQVRMSVQQITNTVVPAEPLLAKLEPWLDEEV